MSCIAAMVRWDNVKNPALPLPLKRIYDKAFIGYVYAATNARCFRSLEDEQQPIPVYDLDMVDEIFFQDNREAMPDVDPDDMQTLCADAIDYELSQHRAIFARKVGV